MPDSYTKNGDDSSVQKDDNESVVVTGREDVDSGSDADSDNDTNSLATDSKLFVSKKNQLMPTLAHGRHVRNNNHSSAVTSSGLLPVPPTTIMSKTLQPNRMSSEGSIC